jgi:phosphoglucosamine mutase
MERRLFGTDGIRGQANTHPMTAEVALALGKAAGGSSGASTAIGW